MSVCVYHAAPLFSSLSFLLFSVSLIRSIPNSVLAPSPFPSPSLSLLFLSVCLCLLSTSLFLSVSIFHLSFSLLLCRPAWLSVSLSLLLLSLRFYSLSLWFVFIPADAKYFLLEANYLLWESLFDFKAFVSLFYQSQVVIYCILINLFFGNHQILSWRKILFLHKSHLYISTHKIASSYFLRYECN